MSAKWHRSRAWDDRHIPAALWPVKSLLRLFSSVWFGVGLLCFVAVYAVLASVPIGLLAKLPTVVVVGATLVGTAGALAAVPSWALGRAMKRRGLGRAAVFPAVLGLGLAMGVAGVWLWATLVWPHLRYDARGGHGLMLFADFVERYKAVTLRRLPGFEMSELEFYAWWPLRVVLLLFVTNMVVATVRRIEFTFKNIGVLSVHTGIVAIALGSVYYSALKLEGDTVLLAGPPDPRGEPAPGPPQDRFFDNTRVALYVGDGVVREQRLLAGVPRYNDYGLDVVDAPPGTRTAWEVSKRKASVEASRPLDVGVPTNPSRVSVDPALQFRLVGYASYAEPAQDWVEVRPGADGSSPSEPLNPLRFVYLLDQRAENAVGRERPVLAYTLLPRIPARRIADSQIAVEYSMGPQAGMSEERWRDLTTAVPDNTTAALVVEVPGAHGGPFRSVYAVREGARVEIGETGYAVEVRQLLPEPPFPIITPGYRDASSSVAVVRVTAPDGTGFDRWVYHRFPEIGQDMLDEKNERGMPRRRDADPAIRISFIDASPLVQVYFDEPVGEGPVRAAIRRRGGAVETIADVSAQGGAVELAPGVALSLGERWAHARAVERPEPVPAARRDKSLVGTHEMAMLAVEVSMDSPGRGGWKRLAWLPFTKYTGIGQDEERWVELPDGRRVSLMFGRYQHRLPGFALQLLDFRMIAYDHRGAPRDYQSVLRVSPVNAPGLPGGGPDFEAFDHVAKLNEPLTAPFMWSPGRSWAGNFFGRLASGLSPHQFKFSQAGWDQAGWMQSQQETDRGLRARPVASFTILGVGNNPGIHIIAGGAILMGAGIPWAFYLKPWLVRREKRRIQREVAEGTFRKPGAGPLIPTLNGSAGAHGHEPIESRGQGAHR